VFADWDQVGNVHTEYRVLPLRKEVLNSDAPLHRSITYGTGANVGIGFSESVDPDAFVDKPGASDNLIYATTKLLKVAPEPSPDQLSVGLYRLESENESWIITVFPKSVIGLKL